MFFCLVITHFIEPETIKEHMEIVVTAIMSLRSLFIYQHFIYFKRVF